MGRVGDGAVAMTEWDVCGSVGALKTSGWRREYMRRQDHSNPTSMVMRNFARYFP